MGHSKAQELKIECFANFIYSARFRSVGQEQRSLRKAFFHWELQRSRTEKRGILEFPRGDDCRRGERSKIRFYLGKRGFFFACFLWCK